jgi:hypothetical protein
MMTENPADSGLKDYLGTPALPLGNSARVSVSQAQHAFHDQVIAFALISALEK